MYLFIIFPFEFYYLLSVRTIVIKWFLYSFLYTAKFSIYFVNSSPSLIFNCRFRQLFINCFLRNFSKCFAAYNIRQAVTTAILSICCIKWTFLAVLSHFLQEFFFSSCKFCIRPNFNKFLINMIAYLLKIHFFEINIIFF